MVEALASQISPDRRSDPAVRKRLSGPAVRAFLKIAEAWQLDTEEQRALLGWPASSTFLKYKSAQAGTLPYDALMRISLALGIYKALHILFADDAIADTWIRLPNTNPLFGGRSALTLMLETGMDGMYHVRRLLDARRGAWA